MLDADNRRLLDRPFLYVGFGTCFSDGVSGCAREGILGSFWNRLEGVDSAFHLRFQKLGMLKELAYIPIIIIDRYCLYTKNNVALIFFQGKESGRNLSIG